MNVQAKCKGCDRDLIWGRNVKTGNLIPLDATAPVYRIIGDINQGTPEIEKAEGLYVSHFATCTKVERFKRPKGASSVSGSSGSGTNGTGK